MTSIDLDAIIALFEKNLRELAELYGDRQWLIDYLDGVEMAAREVAAPIPTTLFADLRARVEQGEFDAT